MNKLNGIITNIQKSGALILAGISVDGTIFSSMLIDAEEQRNWMKPGSQVLVVFKETEVSIAKGLTGKISMRNRILCQVDAIRKGELLSEVSLCFGNCKFISVITTRSVEYLELEYGDEVEALVKANEVSLMKINVIEDI